MDSLTSLAVPCFVVYSKNYRKTYNSQIRTDDRISHFIVPMKTWVICFYQYIDIDKPKLN